MNCERCGCPDWDHDQLGDKLGPCLLCACAGYTSRPPRPPLFEIPKPESAEAPSTLLAHARPSSTWDEVPS